MKLKLPGMLAVAVMIAAVPVTIAIAQPPSPGAERPRLSADVRARLLDGRIAMAKTALNLTSDQLSLWEPVEKHLRTSAAERAQRRLERRQEREKLRESGAAGQRPSMSDRLDRASERMARRAERMKAFAEVFKPFYASLSEEQKVVAGVVLRGPGFGGRGARWALRQGPSDGPGTPKQ